MESQSYKTRLKMSQNLVKSLTKTEVALPISYEIPKLPDVPGSLCNVIHISLVCMNKCSHFLLPMLKSLMHHRQNPLELHILVDNRSEKQTKYLFETWDLPDVKTSFYNAQNRISEVDWIKNSHYSGVYAMLKLLLPNILPQRLEKVIALDADLTFMSDIAQLWALFDIMTKEQFIGLVENESNWYLESSKTRWPALGRGFNTGVMLLDLDKMRNAFDWKKTWTAVVKNNIVRLKETALADQDVINAVISEYPKILFSISCIFNVQMSMSTLVKHCYKEDARNVKIIHWNSPKRLEVKHQDVEYFRNVHLSYVNMDIYLLKTKLHLCAEQHSTNQPKNNTQDMCNEFRYPQNNRLVTLMYYTDTTRESIDNFDVTLVVQLSMDRLQFLERLVSYWEGPLSATIYLSNCELTEFDSFINDWSDTLSMRKNIAYHLVFKHQNINYPVNYLRNVGLENVNTNYVFLIDVDFIPMKGLYDYLRESLRAINPDLMKKVLVVPAFETQHYRLTLPNTKEALIKKIKSGNKFAPFREREWPSGHLATNYTKWMETEAPYEVEWQPNYEPYLVVHRSVPKYDIRFTGFGWNKVSHSVELKAAGYTPWVLPRAFIIHAPHAPSADITKFRVSTKYRACQKLLKQEFLDDLRKKYNVEIPESPLKSDSIEAKLSRDFILNQAPNNAL